MLTQVSWIRHRDTSLLAVNKFVYTTSHRVKVITVTLRKLTNVTNVSQVQNAADSDEWRLGLQPVEITDQGWYSCQVRPDTTLRQTDAQTDTSISII